MEQLIATPVFQLYVASVLVLGGLLLLLANNTAVTRAKHDEAVNPEDKRLNPKAEVVYYGGNSRTQRYRRAHGNALENLPLFMITGFLLTLTGVSVAVAAALFGTFVGFRLIHAVAYLRELQPWRTASFAIAALDQLAILACLGYWVFVGGVGSAT